MLAKSIVWDAPRTVVVRDVEIGEPASGEVIVEAAYSLVSPGTEREWLDNDIGHVVLGTTFPFVPGYSIAGRIAAVGADVTEWSVGDRVVSDRVTGAHAAFQRVAQGHLHAVPDGVAFEDAVFFNLGMTATHVVRLAGVRLGDSLAVVGQGPIGYLAVQVARAQGARPVVALEIDDERRERALTVGATAAIDPTASDATERLAAALGHGAVASIELSAAASGAGVDTAVRATAPLGTVVLSSTVPGRLSYDYTDAFIKGLVFVNSFVNARPEQSQRDLENFLVLVGEGAVRVPSAPGADFSPDAAAEVYDRVLAGDRGLAAPRFVWNATL